jgi:hypothetical protein
VASDRYEIGLTISVDGDQLTPLVELLVAAFTASGQLGREQPKWLTLEEAAALIPLSPDTLAKRVTEPAIDAIRVQRGKRKFYDRERFLKLIDEGYFDRR